MARLVSGIYCSLLEVIFPGAVRGKSEATVLQAPMTTAKHGGWLCHGWYQLVAAAQARQVLLLRNSAHAMRKVPPIAARHPGMLGASLREDDTSFFIQPLTILALS